MSYQASPSAKLLTPSADKWHSVLDTLELYMEWRIEKSAEIIEYNASFVNKGKTKSECRWYDEMIHRMVMEKCKNIGFMSFYAWLEAVHMRHTLSKINFDNISTLKDNGFEIEFNDPYKDLLKLKK